MATTKTTQYLMHETQHSMVKDHAKIVMLVSTQDEQQWSSWWRGVSTHIDHDILRLLFLQQLAYTDPATLIRWVHKAPDIFWNPPVKLKSKDAIGNSLAMRYAAIAPVFLHALHGNVPNVFYKLLDESPVLFKGPYSAQLATWCKSATATHLQALQPLLKQQDDSWYRTDGQRVQWLMEPTARQMLNALFATKNKIVHPALEKSHPGITSYVSVVEGLFSSIREQRKEIKVWLTDSDRQKGHIINAEDFALLM